MIDSTTPAQRLAAALRALRAVAGNTTYAKLINQASRQPSRISLTTSSLGDWFTGKSTPTSEAAVRFLVQYLQAEARRRGGDPGPDLSWWLDLHRQARQVKAPRYGSDDADRWANVPVERQGTDFSISFASQDERWATWIAMLLHRAGYSVEMDVWEWAPEADFAGAMEAALKRASRVVAVFSKSYFTRPYHRAGRPPAAASAIKDFASKVIPVLVEECEVLEPYRTLAQVNLVAVGEETATQRLASRIDESLPRRRTSVKYPGNQIRTSNRALYPADLPPIWRMPPRNSFFVGRQQLIESIHTLLQRTKGRVAAITALHGIGGIGKTQIAIEYAYQHADSYSIIWWINADNPTLTTNALLDLAEELAIPRTTLGQTIERLWSNLSRRRDWLLIYDNVNDVAGIDGLRPPTTGSWLITSRSPALGRLGALVGVAEFDRTESVRLLRLRAPSLKTDEAVRIAETLGDLPLAVEQAAYYLSETGISAADYVSALGERPRDVGLTEATIDRHPGLFAAVTTAFERLEASNPTTAKTLLTLSCFAPEPLPVASSRSEQAQVVGLFGVSLGNVVDTAQTIHLLTQSGLVKRAGRALQIHRLVQLILSKLILVSETADIERRAANMLATFIPGDPYSSRDWPKFALLIPHLQALVKRMSAIGWTDHTDLAQLTADCVNYLYRTGKYQDGLEFAQLCLPRWSADLGKSHPLTLQLVNNLGMCMTGLQEYSAATALYRKLFAQYNEILGSDAIETLKAANNIGVTLNGSKNFLEAADILGPTVDRFRAAIGPVNPETLRAADNLARALAGSGAHEQAVRLAKSNLRLRRRILGANHPDTLFSAYTLGAVLVNLDQNKARIVLSEALKMQLRVLGPEHPTTMRTKGALGIVDG